LWISKYDVLKKYSDLECLIVVVVVETWLDPPFSSNLCVPSTVGPSSLDDLRKVAKQVLKASTIKDIMLLIV
jgi:hypothetical protein